MGKKQPTEYYESIELFRLAEKLISRYSTHLHYVDIDKIYFCVQTGDKPQKAPLGEISGVGGWVKNILNDVGSKKIYCLRVWNDAWDSLMEEQQQWFMFYLLYSIGENCNGSVRKAEITDEYGFMLEYLGPYWRKRGDLPDMLVDDDPIPLPPPYMDLESESDIYL